MAELNASFHDAARAREAQRKLEALRAATVRPDAGGTAFTAQVDDAIIEQATRLIETHGGTAEWN
jgi:precorrin isomerase